ncbi:hypothetical protein [Paenibacillus sp. FJAT-26967]|uniref:hypothetical protein n=1 Tax=Paenibacillus sp. FJAT-26967 TaxID=1729690 RepID=UPI0008395CD4|nr:hypothetical protein [Paenibacillus sp. FJAT-26967]
MNLQLETVHYETEYGDYDCEINALIYWLRHEGIEYDSLLRNNWDFRFDSLNDTFKGTIPLKDQLKHLELHNQMNYSIRQPNELADESRLIVALDAFSLPYAQEHFRTRNQIHYTPVYYINRELIEITDPIFKKRFFINGDELTEYWGHFREPIIEIHCIGTSQVEKPAEVYILQQDLDNYYLGHVNQLQKRITAFLSTNESLRSLHEFKRYYSLFNGMLVAREVFLRKWGLMDAHEEVVHKWKKLMKTWMGICVNPERNTPVFQRNLVELADYEVEFLRKLRL